MSVYEGVDQSINVQLSTFNLAVSPKPILEIYDFIMTTFVPEHKDTQSANSAVGTVAPVAGAEAAPMNSDKLRIRVKLTAIRCERQDDEPWLRAWANHAFDATVLLKDDAVHFATLALTSADVALLMRGGTMRLSASLGNLSLHDETLEAADGAVRRDLLRIEGEDLADFSYETFDSSDKETFPGYNSSVILKAGSLRFTFLEDPIQRVLAFGAEFAQLKAVYDAASQAAIDRAPEVTHMKYDVAVKTPIVVLPRDGMQSEETIVMRLGEIRAHNEFNKRIQGDTSITASLKGVNVASDDSREPSRALQLVDNVNIDLNIWQAGEEIASQHHQVTTETEVSPRSGLRCARLGLRSRCCRFPAGPTTSSSL
jgi:vacuolar protein sorting-associated protein 13A/C